MRFRRISQLGLAVGLLLAVVACGAAGSDGPTTTAIGDPVAPDTTTAVVTETTTAVATETTENDTTTAGENEPDSGDLSDLPEMSGGSAAFTLAGETEEFDWFVCFYGDAAAEMAEDEDVTFIAVGRRGGSFPSMEGVEAQVVASRIEPASGPNYTIFYTRAGSDGTQTNWQAVGFDIAQLEGDRVTFEGDLSPIIDNQPSDEASDLGSLDATCSPNSLGSEG